MSIPEPYQSRGFQFALAILKLYRDLRKTNVPTHLINQLLRSGTSIGANLEEAKAASSRRDLASKYTISLREARECHYWLRLIAADEPIVRVKTETLLDECHQLVAILTTTVRKLRERQ